MKKYGYVFEKPMNLVSLYISIILLVLLISFSLLLLAIKQDYSVIPVIIALGVFLVMCIFGMTLMSKKADDANAARKSGVKVEGKIIEPVIVEKETTDGTDYYLYYLKVKFINPTTNMEQEYQTPELDFNPCQRLASDKCSVYVLDDKIYVTDFQIKKTKEEGPWTYLDPEDDRPPIWLLLLILGPIILLIVFAIIVSAKP